MSAHPDHPTRPPATIVIVGAGPRATGLIERIAANAPELYGDGTPLALHLVDPHPPGGGRIWRPDQSPLLWMNSMAEDVTIFTDESVEREGPLRPGPSLAEWARQVREADLPPELAAEAAALTGQSFATRRLQGAYLRWAYERSVAALPLGTTVHEHRDRAVRVTGPRDGRQQVWLEGRTAPLTADAVVLALGHLDAEPDAEQRALAAFAAEHGLVHLPPEFTADSDLSGLRPGEPVIVRGLGLAFVDLVVLLTEGRGGRYERAPGGELVYRPSGREPVLYTGSRRGVPYHAKIGYSLSGERPPVPRFFGPAQVDALLSRPERPDFRRDVWPLIAKELGFAHYHRLFTVHPERTAGEWPAFEEKYAACPPGSPELDALVTAAVPDPADRLDLDALDHPLAGLRFPTEEALQQGLRAHIEADLARRHDPAHSPDLAVFLALLSVYGQLIRLGDIGGWWHGFFSFLASGPPGPRLEQLLALSRAGVIRFLGAETVVTTDPLRGVFRAGSASVPGHVVEARALVEARLPEPTVDHSRDTLLRSLHRDGAAATPAGLLAVSPADARILDRAGRPHPRRFALGPHTDARASGAFARPRTNAPAFRQNDATARALLRCLRDLSCRASLTA
ncbi:FAD/NAD(P)-binding protein [Streptomyces hygroscopicus]|uniref:FAD/NAD(P)-binding protein n=1 Tax=Streptomyces hygroscopicus TaxID=1912 RepID=UPI0008303B10|nr:FAD/NAD(P)-binding protein [Streptomyces hygroscopicus]GLV74642.1 adenylate cyclase [Streptomyces hygroscopicus subsp. hygroscopicus]